MNDISRNLVLLNTAMRGRRVVTLLSLSLVLTCAGLVMLQSQRAARGSEERVLAVILSRGGQVLDRPLE